MSNTSRIVGLAGFELPRLQKIEVAVFKSEKIEQSSGRVERRGIPIRCTRKSWAHARSRRARFDIGSNRPTAGIDSACPIQFFYKTCREKEFPVDAIENIQKTVAIRLDHKFSRLTAKHSVNQNGSFRGVVVEEVVRSELKKPFELAVVRIEGQQAIGIKVVTGTRSAVEVGCWVARSPKKCV